MPIVDDFQDIARRARGLRPGSPAANELRLLTEIQRRRECRRSFLAWCIEALAPFGQTPAAHHRLLIAELQAVADGLVDRLMIFMPPGSAKSTYVSKLFPAWLMAQGDIAIIGASHTATLAEEFSGDVRRFVANNSETLGFGLANDRADRWRTTNGSEYLAAGVRAGIAGYRASFAIIDDPVKSRQDADSQTFRESTWKWFQADLGPRMKPNGRMILMHCMVGETRVLMRDGTHKRLRNIRPGEEIATYDSGTLGSTVVEDWRSQGHDYVFEIQTQSGATTKANARHPFLVERNGQRTWVSLENLRVGNNLVRASMIGPPTPSGDRGQACVAAGTAAKNSRNAKAIAPAITTNTAGPAESALHHIMRRIVGLLNSVIDTASAMLTIRLSSWPKMAYARSAESRHQPTTCDLIGAASFASTTITSLEKYEDFSATTAISRLDMAKTRSLYSARRNTSGFTLDRVTAIVAAGRDEVFDVQVARTQNFIADGFVSHNTRWHEDDLAGRLLQTQADRWRVLKLPALATDENDPLGRAIDEPLWNDDRYGYGAELIGKRDDFEKDGATREWASLYQQSPRPNEGALFKPAFITTLDACPALATQVRAWDLAATAQTGTRDPDWTVGLRLGRMADGRCVVMDIVRVRGGPADIETLIKATATQDGKVPISLPQDPGQAGKAQVRYLAGQLAGFVVHVSPETGDKATRAAPVAAQCNVGNLLMVRAAWNRAFVDELSSFPAGSKDDQVDALSRAFAHLALAPRIPIIGAIVEIVPRVLTP